MHQQATRVFDIHICSNKKSADLQRFYHPAERGMNQSPNALYSAHFTDRKTVVNRMFNLAKVGKEL